MAAELCFWFYGPQSDCIRLYWAVVYCCIWIINWLYITLIWRKCFRLMMVWCHNHWFWCCVCEWYWNKIMSQEYAMTILKMADMRFAQLRVAKRVKVLLLPRLSFCTSACFDWKISKVEYKFLMFLHISSSWVKLELHTEYQLPGLLGSDMKVWLVVVVVDGWSNQILCHSQLKLWLSCDVTILLQTTNINKTIPLLL